MTINFRFHNHIRKDGTRQLLARMRTHKQETNVPVEGIYIEERFWSKASQLVTARCPQHEIINAKLLDYHQKIKMVQTLYNTKEINFEQAKLMLSSKSAVDSVMTYIATHCQDKTAQWLRNTKCALNRLEFHNDIKKDTLTFEDINRANLLKLRSKMKEAGKVAETYNSYLAHIKAVYNQAYQDKVTFRKFEFTRDLRRREDKHSKQLITHSSEEIYDAIGRIKIESNHRSAREKAIRSFEAVGFWMLKFCMRGGYGKDVTSLTGKNIDFDTAAYRKFQQSATEGSILTLQGNAHFIKHRRHKTGNMMYIWYDLPPMGGLIHILRMLVATTHPKHSYISLSDIQDPTGDKLLRKMEEDLLRIFTHDSRKEINRDDAIWNNLNKRLKSIGLSSFESARKTYSTTARKLNIQDGIKKQLMGQTDTSIQRHYDNYNDPQLVCMMQEAHLRILNHFQMIELFDFWVSRLSAVMKKDFSDMQIGVPSNLIYTHQAQMLPQIIGVNQVELSKDKSFQASFNLPFQRDLFQNGGTIRLRP